MSLFSLGLVTVVAAGTPQQITATKTNASAVYFQTVEAQSGNRVYIGSSALVKSTLVGCYRVLVKPLATPASLDSWLLQNNIGICVVDLSTIYLDSDTTGDGLLISYLA